MHPNIIKIQKEIEPLRQEIINHKVYSAISELEDLRIFMEHHIFAVWDFMSLLKALQMNLTCTTLPWFPVGDPVTRQLINEIVAGEESDVDAGGAIKSHFELYLDAMDQCGANTKPINDFLNALKAGKSFNEAFDLAGVPDAAKDFVNATFETINSGKTHLQAASFTFGREDLIPNMFYSMVNDLNSTQADKVSIFKYYLERHIEVDGDHHSHLALSMTEKLCEKEEAFWAEAEETTKQALQKRIDLWDAAYAEIVKYKVEA
ncbi:MULTISPECIES: DUF3050 domain-containing protein [Pedobacter]|uniref:DUF3050 domain-containing protein n=1 Tax=Pedobacter zeae TaxID=1737356 RepID=A0A7W6P8G6_9SPHI|nr:DUF3050 domain-containing protein [Pedobacter zeae]MBB4110076.1 hypothetical protein [Pedobacter zeae]GGH15885.1 hypothetical protein GCM10007422_38230 [Pedobacter zeae]